MDPETYLSQNFDPSKLTVPNLRSILVEHEVYFASNANKQQLVQIFNDTIKPRAKTLLKKYTKGSVNPISDNSFDEKVIPAKRQLEPSVHVPSSSSSSLSSSNTVKPKKAIKKIRKNKNTSLSDDSSNSFLSIEKFEINENDNIFLGSIDDKSIHILPQTKFADSNRQRSKTPTKKILENFDNSIPSSKKFNVENGGNIIDSKNDREIEISFDNNKENINNTINENKFKTNLFDNKNDDIVLIDDIYEQKNITSTPTVDKLQGPTNIINNEAINVVSENNDGNNKEVDIDQFEFGDDKLDDTVVKTFDVKSLTSLEEDYEDISFSDKSRDDEIVYEKILDKNDDKDVKPVIDIVEAIETEIPNEIIIESENLNETSIEIPNTKPKRSFFKRFFLTTFGILLLTGSGSIYSLRKLDSETGFCGIKSEQPVVKFNLWSKLPESITNNLDTMKPYIGDFEKFAIDKLAIGCKPCPLNAKCESDSYKCNYSYVKNYGIESLYGLLPLRGNCVFDTLREQKLYYLSQYTLKYLHENNAKKISLDELHDYLLMTKETQISDEEFENYWKSFVEYELKMNSDFEFNVNTNEITISHIIPTEYSTRSFVNEQNKRHKTNKLFSQHPPTDDLKKHLTINI